MIRERVFRCGGHSGFAERSSTPRRMREDRQMRKVMASHFVARHCDERRIDERSEHTIVVQVATTCFPFDGSAGVTQRVYALAVSVGVTRQSSHRVRKRACVQRRCIGVQ